MIDARGHADKGPSALVGRAGATDDAAMDNESTPARPDPFAEGADDSFAEAVAGLQALGASPDTEELVTRVARHGAEEGALLAEYARLVATASSPAVRYLMELILADERRHHRTLAEMATAMAWGHFGSGPATATPALDGAASLDEELARATRRLLEHERQDHTELVRLRRNLRPYAHTTMWTLLVDLMIADTDKHQQILAFVLDHLARHRP